MSTPRTPESGVSQVNPRAVALAYQIPSPPPRPQPLSRHTGNVEPGPLLFTPPPAVPTMEHSEEEMTVAKILREAQMDYRVCMCGCGKMRLLATSLVPM